MTEEMRAAPEELKGAPPTEMERLKTLNDQLAEIRAGQNKIAARLGDIAAERFELENKVRGQASAVEAAEQALIAALAAVEMGEPADLEGAQQELNDARLLAQNTIELTQRLHVLDALRSRFEGDAQALGDKKSDVITAMRQAEIAELERRASETVTRGNSLVAELAQSGAALDALRDLLAGRGKPWQGNEIDATPLTLAPGMAVLEAMKSNIRAELGIL